MALSEKQIEALKPEAKRVTLRDDGRGGVAGLELRLSAKGVKTWCVRYTLEDGTRRRLTLGRYPALGLADARVDARDALGQVARRGDPAGDLKRQRQTARAKTVRTLDDLAESLFAAGGVRPSTLAYRQWLWTKHLKPKLGATRLEDVAPGAVRNLIREIGAAAGPVTANRARSLLQRIFNFGVQEEHVPANPLAKIKPMFEEESRARVLTDMEIKALWAVAARTLETPRKGAKDRDDMQVSRAMAIGVLLCLMTAQRGGEVAGMRRGEIDLDARTWLLPAARSKSKREHLVPLSDKAVALITEALQLADLRLGRLSEEAGEVRKPSPTDPVFPSPLDPTKPVARLSLGRAMARLCIAAEVEDASAHDLRRTVATMLASERIGALSEVVSRILNHTPPGLGVTAIYNRHGYIAEKRRALDAWEHLLLSIVGEIVAPSNVVPLTASH